MAEIKRSRFDFLNKGFKCPVCQEAVTHLDIREVSGVGVAPDKMVPTGYIVRCPRCGTQHEVQITSPAPSSVPEQHLTRLAFRRKGFTCPVEGCGATITHDNREQIAQNISPDPPTLYVVRCPRCWTEQVVHIVEKQE